MTDEELANKYTIEYWVQFIKENNDDIADFNFGFSKIIEIAKQLEKENEQLKKQWHNLRKCPDDLPEEDLKEYLVAYQNFNNPNEIVVGYFTWNGVKFLENYNYSEIPYFENKNVLYAWCKLPQFKE